MAVPTTLKTPGVYIDEKNAFPNSVVAVETAVPAFIGFTERAEFGGQSLKNKPVRIESFMEFELFYGKDFQTIYDLTTVDAPIEAPRNYDFMLNNKAYQLSENSGTKFNLYDSLKFFYQNGGGSCFIVSIGTFTDSGPDQPFTSTDPFMKGIDLLKKETEPTMLVIPDAVLFEQNDCYSLQEYMLMHCGEQMNRVAILDIYEGYKGLDNPNDNPVDNFRNQVASDFLSYGAAYYPWLNTTIVQASDVNHKNLSEDGRNVLVSICTAAIADLKPEKKAALSNYLNLINTLPPTIAMRDTQSKIDSAPSTKVIQLTSLIEKRIKAESGLQEAMALSNDLPERGTKIREAGAILDLAKSNYDSFLKDAKNIPDTISASVNKITTAVSGLDAGLKTARATLDTALKMPDDVAPATKKADAIIAAKKLPQAELDKIYNNTTSKFIGDILTELGTANTNLSTLTADLLTAKTARDGYYVSMAADPKAFAETANYELADAVDGLANAKSALTIANSMADGTAKINAQNLANQNITNNQNAITAAKDKLNIAKGSPDPDIVNNALSVAIPQFKLVMENILKKKNLLPPAAAMAGIYSLVDSQRGVWKAPANVAVSSVVSPAVLIDYEQQEDLNAPIQGKAICAIRPFIGLGTMVWGARTLNANSLDWRYINVRRTMIMLEQSIKFAAKAYIFEPNVKNTWVSIESMIENFLTNLWKLGALAGAVPTDAFSVSVGLGSTMTANDILEGRMNIEVRVAISHPAEFIVITFQQQQQKS